MTRLGFVLDSGSCIGCHACTIACKSEHDVPLSVNRTWLKYVETGSHPNTDREFSVMRCNHCDDAPCMTICPTSALHRTANGVVDFQDEDCIGCKACMNACPYDAIYLNPETKTAHKCNFCNHRLEDGLEPSCVIVCPTQAIRVGDLDDPDSEIARLHADGGLVRSPEQNTRPKVIYMGATASSLDPLASAIAPDGMIWADTTPGHSTPTQVALSASPDRADGEAMARTAYTTQHPPVWGAMVSGYLVTKAIAAGVMLVAALLVALGHGDDVMVSTVPAMVAGAFLAATGALLIGDLKQPKRFWYLITKGNRTSWLVKGSYVLGAFASCLAAWWLAGLADAGGALPWLALPTVAFALGTAGYTAFLFGQCEGRDLWQQPVLLPLLLAQAVVAGGATYSVLDLLLEVPGTATVQWTLFGGLVANGLLVVLEMRGSHSRHVTMALAEMTGGIGQRSFRQWRLDGLVMPLVLVVVSIALGADDPLLPAVAAPFVLHGLYAYEDAYVRAGQAVPLS
ncbi:MAG: 4Fe-4S dicluster domain-containing protein [Actinomycetota bacterium]|nr:4Fe-4S dicluster domain-containing protein [Actinomycetota bacterium]MED6328443.1 4Fe-4S dicluster domain-containing protein [Actinomycetota bacterium]